LYILGNILCHILQTRKYCEDYKIDEEYFEDYIQSYNDNINKKCINLYQRRKLYMLSIP